MSSGKQYQNTASSKSLPILTKDAENDENSDYQRNKSHHVTIWKNSLLITILRLYRIKPYIYSNNN